MREIDLFVIHCSATRVNTDYTVYQLMKDHKDKGFRPPFGYHYYIPKAGAVIKGRPIEDMGAHAKGYNANSIGICYEGGLNEQAKAADTRTNSQKSVLLHLINEILFELKKHQNIGHIEITGHRDLSPDPNHDVEATPDEWMRQCPCFNTKAEYRNAIREFISIQGEYKP